jgi:hypothetical protein
MNPQDPAHTRTTAEHLIILALLTFACSAAALLYFVCVCRLYVFPKLRELRVKVRGYGARKANQHKRRTTP